MNGHFPDRPDWIDAAIDDTVRALTQAELPAGLRSRVLAGVEARPRGWFQPASALAAAAAVVAIAIGVLFVRSHQPAATPAPVRVLASRADLDLPVAAPAPVAPASVRPARRTGAPADRDQHSTLRATSVMAASSLPAGATASEDVPAADQLSAGAITIRPLITPAVHIAPLGTPKAFEPSSIAIVPIHIAPLTVGPLDTSSSAAQGDHR